MMPEMDGIEATQRIRALSDNDRYFKNVPIVALTANAVSGTKEMFLENGFSDFLSKPVDTVKLDSLLAKWIPIEKREKVVVENGTDSIVRDHPIDSHLEIDGLDVKKGLALSRGNIENYKRTLGIFHRDGLAKVEQIKTTLETDALHLYVTYVHALKSATAYIGAGDLSEMAEALEVAGIRKDLEFIQTHTPKFLAALESVLTGINTALESDSHREQMENVDMALLNVELAKLAEAIENVNPRAIKDATKSIQLFTHAADIGNTVEKILQHTLVGEFDEAVAMINALHNH